MIDWRTSQTMVLFALLLAGVLSIAIYVEFDLGDRLQDLDLATLIPTGPTAPPPVPIPADDSTGIVAPTPAFPVQYVPRQPRNPFAPDTDNG